MAADPSHNVHPDLLPHIHLISAYRYPLVPRFGIPEVTEWLLNAPRIARDGAPFFWTYLDAPQDGTIILTWQPLQRLGTEFATDGYVWPRGEVYYQHEIRDGLILEVFHQPVGYRPGEEYASHSRRRFRLMPPKVPNPNIPQVDPSLWLVHYGPVDEREPIPVKKIRLEPRLRTILEHRNNLQRAGQIARKEFMLSDRVNWPHIPLPRDMRGPPMYGGVPVAGHHVPQQMAYPPHVAGNLAPPPPSKRARHSAGPGPGAGAVHPGAGLVGGQPGMGPPPHMMQPMDMAIYDDDEDTSRGDMFDNITPRDVSLERYKQNHEWMEEVISSPYRIGQIGYADLGLGLKGELAPITEGIFEGQGFDAYQRVPKKPYVGRLDPGLADEFRKRVNEKIQATHAEIAEMKAHHEKQVANFREQSVIRAAEHELRICAAVIEEGPGSLRLEERPGESNDAGSGEAGDNNPWTQSKSQEHHQASLHKTVDDIATHVESALSHKIVPLPAVVRVQDGGYQEPEPEPEPEPVPEPEPMLEVPPMAAGPTNGGAVGGVNGGNVGGAGTAGSPGSQISGIMIGDGDMDMGDTAAGLLDQMESVFSPEAGDANGPGNGPPAQQAVQAGPGGPQPGPGGPVAGGDIPMSDVAPGQAAATVTAPAVPGGAPTGDAAAPGHDDWVVVPPGGGVSPAGEAAAAAAAGAPAAAAPGGNVPVPGGSAPTATTESTPGPLAAAGGPAAFQVPVTTAAVPAAPAPAVSAPAPVSAPVPVPVPAPVASNAPGSGVSTPGGLLEGGDNSTGNDFGELADLDTAGDALASLDDGGDLGESLDLDMDDSAFGNAFHGGD